MTEPLDPEAMQQELLNDVAEHIRTHGCDGDHTADTEPLAPFDAANYITSPEDVYYWLEACIEEADGDAGFLLTCLGALARSDGYAIVNRDLQPTPDAAFTPRCDTGDCIEPNEETLAAMADAGTDRMIGVGTIADLLAEMKQDDDEEKE